MKHNAIRTAAVLTLPALALVLSGCTPEQNEEWSGRMTPAHHEQFMGQLVIDGFGLQNDNPQIHTDGKVYVQGLTAGTCGFDTAEIHLLIDGSNTIVDNKEYIVDYPGRGNTHLQLTVANATELTETLKPVVNC